MAGGVSRLAGDHAGEAAVAGLSLRLRPAIVVL
jgi:hypothetical protein